MNLRFVSCNVFAFLMLGAIAANADSLVTIRPTGTDSVNWSQFGLAILPNPFRFLTMNGVSGIGTYSNVANGIVDVEGINASGNFALGDYVNYSSGGSLLTLTFAQGYNQIGAQIAVAYFVGFTAQICDVNGCFTEDGFTNGNEDNSAIYIGIESASPIDWVTFSVTKSDFDIANNRFIINELTLDTSEGPSPTPEPSSFFLLGTGLLGMAGMIKRKLLT